MNKKLIIAFTITILLGAVGGATLVFMFIEEPQQFYQDVIIDDTTGGAVAVDDSLSDAYNTLLKRLSDAQKTINELNESLQKQDRRGHSHSSSTPAPVVENLDWDTVYSYEDDYSNGSVELISGDEVEVSRAFAWRGYFDDTFIGKVKIIQDNNNFSWYGSRLAIVDDANIMKRYEIRLNPTNDLQVYYVDRTNRTGDMTGAEPNTISEKLDSTECIINTDQWYYTTVVKQSDGKWKVAVVSSTNPTCFIEWQDYRIDTEKPLIGIQSAGKYIVSRFDKVIAI